MRIRQSLLLVSILSWCGTSPCLTAESWSKDTVTSVSPGGDILCGAKCLYISLVALDVDPGGYEKFLIRCGEVEQEGFSIGRLAEVAQSYGVETLAVNTTLANLKQRRERLACIAHVDGHHFVNIGDVDDGTVWVINSPFDSSVAREVFEAHWRGDALLLSKTVLTREEDLVKSSLFQSSFHGWRLVLVVIAAGIVARGIIRRRASR